MKLSKYMTREHSLFYAYVWNEANRDLFDAYIPEANIKNMVFKLDSLGVLEVYYDLEELDRVGKTLVQKIIQDPQELDRIISAFYRYWSALLPYIKGEKKIKSAVELKEYYDNWTRWWAPMAFIFMIPDENQVLEDLRRKALKVRGETQEYSDSGDRVFENYIKSQYPSFQDISNLLTPDEAYQLGSLSEEEIVDIRKRAEGCALVTFNGKSKILSLLELNQELKNVNSRLEDNLVDQSITEIKGSSASKGKVVGKARLVLAKSSLNDVQKGEVMVTYATSPDYVPAMKKCAAIITDEGGVVCHAAIVSRELGIPCVVGTKIGTKVLKTGILVEVDADKGIVTIIE